MVAQGGPQACAATVNLTSDRSFGGQRLFKAYLAKPVAAKLSDWECRRVATRGPQTSIRGHPQARLVVSPSSFVYEACKVGVCSGPSSHSPGQVGGGASSRMPPPATRLRTVVVRVGVAGGSMRGGTPRGGFAAVDGSPHRATPAAASGGTRPMDEHRWVPKRTGPPRRHLQKETPRSEGRAARSAPSPPGPRPSEAGSVMH